MRYVNHKLPVEKIAISASQCVYPNQKIVDAKEATGYEFYQSRGLMSSVKFKRTVQGIRSGFDENKAVFPVYGRVPLFVPETIAALRHGLRVAVLGSHDVGMYVDQLKTYLKASGQSDSAKRLSWTPELDGMNAGNNAEVIAQNWKRLTLSNSVSRLARELKVGKNEIFLFTAGDLAFYKFGDAVNDPDLQHYGLVLNLNAEELIKAPVDRNYYQVFITADGRRLHIKEPNIWGVGGGFSLANADLTYDNAQKGGFGAFTLLKMIFGNVVKDWRRLEFKDAGNLVLYGMQGIATAFYNKMKIDRPPVFRQESIEKLGSFIDDCPIRVKADHDDWLRLKDVDAWHDFVFFWHLFDKHIDAVFPESIVEDVRGFDEHLGKKKPSHLEKLYQEFPIRMADKLSRINALIPGGDVAELVNVYDGHRLLAQPRADENIALAVERCISDKTGYSF
jgi:hypothetical protein